MKRKVIPTHAMKAYKGNERFSPTYSFLRHYIKVRGQYHVPAALPREKAVGAYWVRDLAY